MIFLFIFDEPHSLINSNIISFNLPLFVSMINGPCRNILVRVTPWSLTLIKTINVRPQAVPAPRCSYRGPLQFWGHPCLTKTEHLGIICIAHDTQILNILNINKNYINRKVLLCSFYLGKKKIPKNSMLQSNKETFNVALFIPKYFGGKIGESRSIAKSK